MGGEDLFLGSVAQGLVSRQGPFQTGPRRGSFLRKNVGQGTRGGEKEFVTTTTPAPSP